MSRILLKNGSMDPGIVSRDVPSAEPAIIVIEQGKEIHQPEWVEKKGSDDAAEGIANGDSGKSMTDSMELMKPPVVERSASIYLRTTPLWWRS